MKKLIIFSDVHGETHNLMSITSMIQECDEAIFLGDGIAALEILSTRISYKITAVRGNCDWFCPLPDERVLLINNKKVLLTHGHHYDVKNGINKIAVAAKVKGVDLVLFGHTHTSKTYELDGITLINVGALKNGHYCELIINDDRITAIHRNVKDTNG